MKKFFRSIKFKLTLWYSLVLLILGLIFVISVNVMISQYMGRPYQHEPFAGVILEKRLPSGLQHLSEDNRRLVHEARQQDLQTIREISILSLIPLTVFSFMGGYFISDRMLSPLKQLNAKIGSMTTKDLTHCTGRWPI